MDLLKDKDFLDFLSVQESQNIVPAYDFTELAVQSFEEGEAMAGLQLPWPKTHERFQLRKGEVTLWAGINGHGKSQLLGQICALTLPVSKWLVASLEMPVRATLHRMVRQMAGFANPSKTHIESLMKTTDGQLWIYDQLDTIPADRIIAMIHYAATKLGIENIILDSLVKCGLGVDDYNAQKKFVDKLCWAAKTHNIHIHLVHHVRKSEREGKVPDKFDIKGAGEITDLVDNVCIIHRNKDKEAKIREGKQFDKLEPDTSLIVAKQRHAGIEDRFALYFHPDSQQFLSGPDARPFQTDVRSEAA
ncbi:MAG: AAA family ATPase [Methylophaga sp.]|nr:MAG: AAA family ATPase [Methylophaga sp.]